jgi:NitT/TauT family transport system ATP-binding protein
MTTPIITIKSLSKIFPGVQGEHRTESLKDVSLTVHKGEFLILLGPSGCGKSTLLRILAGLETKTGGEVEYGADFDLNKASFVFQNFGILPWLTVEKNVELNLIAKNILEHERMKEVRSILEVFGLTDFKDHYPHDLSGGMRQRVGLARAFVSKPDIIFLDEPFSELDFYTAESLRDVLLTLWKERGTTVVMVSHYIDEAVALADRIAIFSDRPGSVRAVVKNELSRPRASRSENFFALEDEVLKHFK